MASRLRFERLVIRGLRNLSALELEPAPRLNVIVGDNGQGKTSVLEAIYLVATTKSFRAEKLATLIQAGGEQASVVASVREDGALREQRTVLGPRSRVARLDGKAPKSLGAYATRTPVVVFCPADLELVSGGAAGRRRLLDRVGLFVDPPGTDARLRYEQAVRSRQRVLDERGPGARELDAFEQVMAEDGARFALARERAAGGVRERLAATFAHLATPELVIRVTYEPGGTPEVESFKRKLFEMRPADARRGAANFGPQRDELALDLDGRPARSHASQGQQRLLTLALKLTELDCIREARGADPVLLLDDVSSELDPERTLAVHELLASTPSQVFITTTRADLFPERPTGSLERADFRLSGGALVESSRDP
jgi:DNA replication and repair protein RecF